MSNTVSTAVAKRQEDKAAGPATLVRKYRADFAQVLPSHIKPDTFVRVAAGALKKGEKDKHTGITRLEQAAANNTAAFLSALLDAARLGLEPGTEQYYLTPRRNKKNQGREEILGIVGYQGYIELMYRAGAISSVVVEVVRKADHFAYSPGRMERPEHEIDWDAEDRGPLRLVYAYAVMKDGSTSKVVVLNRADIAKIKESADGADSKYSPWVKHEEAMWMKSAVRQLAKWVPTSAEYITAQKRAENAANEQPTANVDAAWIEPAPVDVIDSEVVDEPEQDTTDEDQADARPVNEDAAEDVDGDKVTRAQLDKVHAQLGQLEVKDKADKLATVGLIVGRSLSSTSELTKTEASSVIDLLDRVLASDDPGNALDSVLAELHNATAAGDAA